MLAATDPRSPDLAYLRLHPRVRTLWLLGWATRVAVVGALLMGVPLAALVGRRQGAVWLLAGSALLTAAYAGLGLARTLLRYRCTGYRLGEESLDLARGVWWRSETTTPYFRVQHVDIAQGPLERLFGLSKLVVHTASARQRMTIPGVASAEVEALRGRILASVGRDDGV